MEGSDEIEFKGVIFEPLAHIDSRIEVFEYFILRWFSNHGLFRGLSQVFYFRREILTALVNPQNDEMHRYVADEFGDRDFPCYISDINSERTRELIADKDIDLGIVRDHRYIETETLQAAEKGFINIHPGILPDYPGLAPFFWTLYNDEDEGGITVHFMDERIDGGDIVHIEKYPISEEDTVEKLKEKSSDLEVLALRKSLKKILEGFEGRKQQKETDLYFMPTLFEMFWYYLKTGDKCWK